MFIKKEIKVNTEDDALEVIASKRDNQEAGYVSHEEVWR